MTSPLRLPAILLPLLLAAAPSTAHTQGLPPPPDHETAKAPDPHAPVYTSFDVASIRENKIENNSSGWQTTSNGIKMTNMHLDALLSGAYRVKQDLISGGPAWMQTKGWDIEAKVLPAENGQPVKLTEAQQHLLLRALLEDRFRVKAHIETKVLPTYELVVAKTGSKMTVAPPDPNAKAGEDDDRGTMMENNGHIEAQFYPMKALAEMLGYLIHRTVLDKTGLTASYNFNLDYTPDERAASAGTDAHPPLFVALPEQLGLRLVPAKGPVDTLVVDHVELPTAN